MNNAAMNICIQLLCAYMFSILLHMYLGVELLIHIETLCLITQETANLISQVAAPLYSPTSNTWGFQFL